MELLAGLGGREYNACCAPQATKGVWVAPTKWPVEWLGQTHALQPQRQSGQQREPAAVLSDAAIYQMPTTCQTSCTHSVILILHSQLNLYNKSLSKHCYSHSTNKKTEALSGVLLIHCSKTPVFLHQITKPEKSSPCSNFNDIFFSLSATKEDARFWASPLS